MDKTDGIIKGIKIGIHRPEGKETGKIAYMLLPIPAGREWLDSQARELGVTIVTMLGMDWDNVFSPWAAPGEPPGSPDFKGEAGDFLKLLTGEVMPSVEARLNATAPERTLCGVSMSGLFAVWARTQTDVFRNVVSVSGSFWYPGFTQWLAAQTPPEIPGSKVWMSLGRGERRSPVKAFRSVAQDTEQVESILQAKGIETTFTWVSGNHYSPMEPRFSLAFQRIFA